jgi:hypothetical protein
MLVACTLAGSFPVANPEDRVVLLHDDREQQGATSDRAWGDASDIYQTRLNAHQAEGCAARRQCCGGTPEAFMRFVLRPCVKHWSHTRACPSVHPLFASCSTSCHRRDGRTSVPWRRALEHQGNFDMLRSLTCHLQARLAPMPCTRWHAPCMARAGWAVRAGLQRPQCLCPGSRGLRRRAQAHQGGMGMVGVSPRYAARAAHKFSQFWRLPHRERVVKVGTLLERHCC